MSKDGKSNTESKRKKIARANNDCSKKKLRRKPEKNIAKSKQLVEKLQTYRHKSGNKPKRTNTTRFCDNGKPMPSLSELEMMFEDSEDDEEPKIVPVNHNSLLESSSAISPSTIKRIADKMMDIVSSNMLDPDSGNPPPIVPERSNILSKSNDDNINKIEDKRSSNKDDASIPNHKSKRDDIASWLKFCENSDHSDGSIDSNNTIDYDINKSNNICGRPSLFFPLPSTSRDSETINKNDQLFTESLLSETINDTCNEQTIAVVDNKDDIDDSDIKILETPCETIVIDDDIEILQSQKTKSKFENNILECIDIAEPDIRTKSLKPTEVNKIIDVDDYEFENPGYDEVTEVIDIDQIDSIIAENKAIINKHSTYTNTDINTVTYVDSSTLSTLNNNERTFNTNSVIIDDDCSCTQRSNAHQNKLQPVMTESPSDIVEVSDLEINDIRGHSVHNNRAMTTGPVDRICDINHQHHTASEHDAIFKRCRTTQTGNPQQVCNIKHRHHTASEHDAIFKRCWTTQTDNPQQTCHKNHKHHTSSDSNQSSKRFKKGKGINSKENQPSVQQAAPSPVKNFGDCPICMDSLTNKSLASTICGHIFCLKCIEAAFKTSGKRCPTCRKALKKGGYHQIFL